MYATHLTLLSNSMGAQNSSLRGKYELQMESYKESQEDKRKRKKVTIRDFDLYNSMKAKKTSIKQGIEKL